MDRPTQERCIVIISLLTAAALGLAFQKDPVFNDKIDVSMDLPERVGDYVGKDLLFCQNELCKGSSSPIGDIGQKVCPQCGEPLGAMSLAERRLLPPGTMARKKRYENSFRNIVFVSIVTTGNERRSIHRPEVCLPAQGYAIESRTILPVDIPGRNPLEITLLNLRSSDPKEQRKGEPVFFAYAYWFAGGGRETPSHFDRVLWASVDRIVHGINNRWAYITIATERREGSDEHISRISSFAAALYPIISRTGREPETDQTK